VPLGSKFSVTPVGKFAIQLRKHVGATVATATGAENFDLVKCLDANILIDYRKDDFEKILHDYDLVLNSPDANTLEKSLRVLKPGGKVISISGPPNPAFAKQIGLPGYMNSLISVLSFGVGRKVKHHHVNYAPSADSISTDGSVLWV